MIRALGLVLIMVATACAPRSEPRPFLPSGEIQRLTKAEVEATFIGKPFAGHRGQWLFFPDGTWISWLQGSDKLTRLGTYTLEEDGVMIVNPMSYPVHFFERDRTYYRMKRWKLKDRDRPYAQGSTIRVRPNTLIGAIPTDY